MAARMKFICDTERCIDCMGCVTACKNEHETPWGVNRRRVVTIGDGAPGEHYMSVACMHCTNAPCMAVCPVDCFYRTTDGVVLHDKDQCIGCGYCSLACPFGAPQFPSTGAFNHRGKMDKCTFCNGGPQPDASEAEFQQYGRNRIAEGKLPLCAEMCGTKALLGGDANIIALIYKQRVDTRGYGPELWGWDIAYNPQGTPPPGKAGAPMNGGAQPGQGHDANGTGANGPATGISGPEVNGSGLPAANGAPATGPATAGAGTGTSGSAGTAGIPATRGPDGTVHDNSARGQGPRPNQLLDSFQNNPRQLPG